MKEKDSVKALTVAAQPLLGWQGKKEIAHTEDYREAANILVSCRKIIEEAEDERKSMARPINQGLRALNARYKKITKPLDGLVKHLEMLMREYEEVLRKEAAEKVERRATAAEQRGELQFAIDLRNVAKVDCELPECDSLRMRKIWRAKVVDLKTLLLAIIEDRVPEDIISISPTKLNSLASAYKESLEKQVPGLVSYTETSYVRR